MSQEQNQILHQKKSESKKIAKKQQGFFITENGRSLITSFFNPPPEKFYIDPINNKKYIQPDHSRLLKEIGFPFAETGGYKGCGLSRHQSILLPNTTESIIYDVVYLTKQDEQISVEKKSTSWFRKINPTDKEYFKNLSLHQAELYIKHKSKYIQIARESGYKRVKFCATEELVALGFEKKVAELHHAVLFFYPSYEEFHYKDTSCIDNNNQAFSHSYSQTSIIKESADDSIGIPSKNNSDHEISPYNKLKIFIDDHNLNEDKIDIWQDEIRFSYFSSGEELHLNDGRKIKVPRIVQYLHAVINNSNITAEEKIDKISVFSNYCNSLNTFHFFTRKSRTYLLYEAANKLNSQDHEKCESVFKIY